MRHVQKCNSKEYRIYIYHEFEDGELFAEIECDVCGAKTKARIRFIEVIE